MADGDEGDFGLEVPTISRSFQELADAQTDYQKVASLRHGFDKAVRAGTVLEKRRAGCFGSATDKYKIELRGNVFKLTAEKPGPQEIEYSVLDSKVSRSETSKNVIISTQSRTLEIVCRNARHSDEWVKAFEMAKGNDLRDFYKVEGLLGSGSFGSVFAGEAKETGEKVAIKKMIKDRSSERALLLLERELHNLTELNHPNVVKTIDIFETENSIYFVMELMNGGDLVGLYEKRISEEEAKRIMHQVLRGVAYLHSKGLVHRDIKPQNILLKHSNRPAALVKIADFGLAQFIPKEPDTKHPEAALYSRVGTALFMAPELLLRKPYDEKVDTWACGVMLHLMLYGTSPFLGKTKVDLFRSITSNTREESPNIDVSPAAVDLMNKLLASNPKERLSAAEGKAHPWFGDLNT